MQIDSRILLLFVAHRNRFTFSHANSIIQLDKPQLEERVTNMGNVKNIVSIIMTVVLVAFCFIVVTCDLSIAVKCFAIFAAVYGFFELRKWRKNKQANSNC